MGEASTQEKQEVKLVLVGENNPFGSDPEYALFPFPENSAGARLRTIFGLSKRNYLDLSRMNLCDGPWSRVEARLRAQEIRLDPEHDVIVTLGRKVARAFFLHSTFFRIVDERATKFVVLPHPSGLCRVWNEPGAAKRARDVMRSVAPGVPWGEQYDE